ncbi:LysR family transcriptional regulator [Vibrio rhodolitus]|uniref:LysR family transcriptional regulator n=1 Tax=Vibrio rhodolitus TaxID=2231649 RepID=UPI001ABF3A26|nr:LysR family transcriptional regulator [Vibrio rhodolitus]
MDKYRNMQLFCTVVDQGSFAKAAKSLKLTPAIVGRHIAALENQLGFVLLNRTTRSMQLTPGGRGYYEGARAILNEIDALEDSLSSTHQVNPTGLIRLSAPDAMGPILMQAIKLFRHDYPNIRFDLVLANQQLDLIKHEIDLTFRFAFELQDSSYIATKLGQTTMGLYASPGYLQLRGTPTNLADLEQHDCLHMGTNRYGDNWILSVDGRNVTFRQPWIAVISDTHTLIQAVIDEMGIVMLPKIFVSQPLSKGELVEIKGIAEFPPVGIYGMYPTRKHIPYRLSLFLDHLKQWMPHNLPNIV